MSLRSAFLGRTVAVGLLSCFLQLRAAPVTWSPPAGSAGSWSDGANWDVGHAPATGDDVIIGPSTPVTPIFAGPNVELNSLNVSSFLAIASGVLTVHSPAQFFDSGVEMLGGQLAGGAILHGGVLGFADDATNSGTFFLQGSAALQGNIPPGVSVWVRGANQDGHALATWSGGGTNGGTLRLESIDGGWTSQLTVDTGQLVNAAVGSITFNVGAGGYRSLNAPVINFGTIGAGTNCSAELHPPLADNLFQLNQGVVQAESGAQLAVFDADAQWLGGLIAGRVGVTGSTITATVPPTEPGGTLFAWGANSVVQVGFSNVTLWVQGDNQFNHAVLTATPNAEVSGVIHFESTDGGWRSDLDASQTLVLDSTGVLSASGGTGGTRNITGTLVNGGAITISSNTYSTFTGHYRGAGGVTGGPFHLVNSAVDFTASPAAPTELVLNGQGNVLGSDIPSGQTLWLQGGNAAGHAALQAAVGVNNHGLVRLASIDGGWNEDVIIAGDAWTNAPDGSISVESGTGGARGISGDLFNAGVILVSSNVVCSVSGGGQPVWFHESGSVAVDPTGRFEFLGGLFQLTGGSLSGEVATVNATNWVTSSFDLPATFAVEGPASVLAGNESPSATLWVRGGNRNGHAILNVPLPATNRGVVHLESVDGGWASDLRTGSNGVVFLEGALTVSAGSQGERRFDGTLVNRGRISVDPAYGIQFYGAFENNGGSVSGPAAFVNVTLSLTAPASPSAPALIRLVGSSGSLTTDNPLNTSLRIEGGNAWGNGQVSLPAVFHNSGHIELDTLDGAWGASLSSPPGSLLTTTPGGSLSVLPGAGGPRAIGAAVVNQGEFDLSTAAQIPALTNASGGVFAANGTVQLTSQSFLNAGGLNFGTNFGVLHVAGNFIQGPGGVASLKLDHPAAGSAVADQLQVDGSATLAGALVVSAPAGFAPASTDMFDVLAAGTRHGQFSSLSLPALTPGSFLSPIYTSTRLRLAVAPGAGLVAQTFDAVHDFSASSNPSGPWSYLWSNAGSPLAPLPDQEILGGSAAGVRGWWNGLQLPNSAVIARNLSSATVSYLTIQLPTNVLEMDPESEAVAVRFTAPTNGQYVVTGLFQLIDTGSHAHQLSVARNSQTVLFKADTTGFGFGASFPFDLPSLGLNAGDTLDFAVASENGDFANLSTGLRTTIALGADAAAAAPSITQQPRNVRAVNGGAVMLTVAATGAEPLSYQWQQNGNPIPGATNADYDFSLSPTAAGPYSVLVSNGIGSVLSDPATVVLVNADIARGAAASTNLPAAPGDGVSIEIFNGIGGGGPPSDVLIAGLTPSGTTLSPVIDFPNPGPTVNVGSDFSAFFADTTTPPAQVRDLEALNFVLRNQFFLRVSKDLDLDPSTAAIDIGLGVGSDDGFSLTVGSQPIGNQGDRSFAYTWFQLTFEGEGLYPVELLYDANATGQSGLQFSWQTADDPAGVLVPQSALYTSPVAGDRLVTFEGFPEGSVVSNQYESLGIVFSATAGVAVTSARPQSFVPVSPTHVFGDPATNAPDSSIDFSFVTPFAGQAAVSDFVRFFLINATGPGAAVTAFDPQGATLFHQLFQTGAAAQQAVAISATNVGRVHVDLGAGTNAAAIDNVAFAVPTLYIPPPSDLVVASVSTPAVVYAGSPATVAWVDHNIGAGAASNLWTDHVYLVAVATGAVVADLGAAPIEPTAVPLRAKDSATNSFTFTLPPATPTTPYGSYAVRIVVDATQNVPESTFTNNTLNSAPLVFHPEVALSLSLSPATVSGGQQVHGTVSRDDNGAALAVQLTSSDSGHASPPASVTIAAGQTTAAFDVATADDGLIRPPLTITLAASAAGASSASSNIIVLGRNPPAFSFNILPATNSEAAGPAAFEGVITPPSPLGQTLTFALTSDNPRAVALPPTVTLEARQTNVVFPIGAIDDPLVQPNRVADVSATLVVDDQELAALGPVSITLTEAEVPTLFLSPTNTIVPEGSSTVVSVRRNTIPAGDLTVTLSVDDPAKMTVPSTVTITNGADHVTFTALTINDGLNTGDFPVNLSASADGFVSATNQLTVADINLPDLVATAVSGPTNAVTGQQITASYTFTNAGLSAAQGPFLVRLYLATGPNDANPTLVNEYQFVDSLPPGGAITLQPAFFVPSLVGQFFFELVVDPTGLVNELSEANNTIFSTTPIAVGPAYVAVVQAGVTNALAGTPITLSGRAYVPGSGAPAPYVLVSVHVITAGFDQTIAALTDGNGDFSTVYQPLPGAGGFYTVTAAFPGEGISTLPFQSSFTLIGLAANPGSVSLSEIEEATVAGQVLLNNLSAIPLTGLQAKVLSDSSGLNPRVNLSASALAGGGQAVLSYQFSAGVPQTDPKTFVIEVSTKEGALTEVSFQVGVNPLRPQLVATPGSLAAGMLAGQARTVNFSVANLGAIPAGPLTVALPPAPWVGLASTNRIPALPPGASNTVSLVLMPASDLPLGEYTGNIVLSGTNASIAVPFNFRAISDAKGDLTVSVVDEYTYYAAGGPKVTNAAVLVRDSYSGAIITNGVTDATGTFVAGGLPEGYYDLSVSATKHSSYDATIFLSAGSENLNEVFLARQTVQFIWTVVPTTIQDRTQLTIETVFETVVPVPVVTLDPTVIDLGGITNATTYVNLTVANHGLLAAQNTQLQFPTHPLWKFTPLVRDLGDLPANSSLVVPVRIDWIGSGPPGSAVAKPRGRGGPTPQAGNSGPCSTAAQVVWSLLCGPRINTYSSGVQIINAANDCGSTPVGGFAGGGGGGGVGGAFYSVGMPFVKRPDVCSCDYFPKICIDAGAQIKFDGIADAVASQLLKLLPNFSVFDKNVSLSISGQLCTCCISNMVSYTASGSGTASIKIVLRGGVTPSGKFKADAGTWKDVSINGDFLLGAEATIQANLKVGLDKTCLGDPKTCITGTASLTVFGGTKGSAGVSATDTVTGLSFSGNGSFNLGAQGTGSATVSWCAGQGGKISVCGKVEVLANISASLKAVDPQTGLNISKTFSANGDGVLAMAGDCGGNVIGGGPVRVQPQDITDLILGPDDFLTPESQILAALGVANAHPGVCAQVQLQIDQDAILTRNAFRATLQVIDTDAAPLESFKVEVHAYQADGTLADNLFGIEPPVLAGVPAVDGSASIDAGTDGSVQWTIIPTVDAVTSPTQFLIGGAVHYTQSGIAIDEPLAQVPITVYPSPILEIQYFHQRDVFADDPFTPQIEPSIPFDLAVFVQNHGYGTAHDFSVVSSQPQIVDNQKGLLVSFQIIGTEVEGQNLTPSLTANFGDIGPDTNGIAVWLLTSTIQGLFVDYSASFKHVDDLGNPRLSIIDAASIHEMIHLVEAGGPFEDGRSDFLVNDNTNYPEGLPDKLYLSDGSTNDVVAVLTNSIDGPPSVSHPQVALIAPMPAGWGFLQVPEPSDGQMHLSRIVRSDGVELPIDKLFWTTDRTFIGMGQRPLYENLLHLLDYDSTGRYTLYYESIEPPAVGTPRSSVAALPAQSAPSFTVSWSGSDGPGRGVAVFDIYVSVDGGAFTSWITNTTSVGAIYPGMTGHSYRFYSVATDFSGVRETTPGSAQAQTTVAFAHTGPVLSPVPNQTTLVNHAVNGVGLQVTDDEAPVAQLVIAVDSSNPALIPPANVAVMGNTTNRTITITPASGLVGVSTITLSVSDGTASASVQFTVTVTRPVLPPVANPATFSYHAFQELQIDLRDLLPSDTDPNGLALTITSVSAFSTNGAAVRLVHSPKSLLPGYIEYLPANPAPVADQFTYTVSNGTASTTGVVNLMPTPLPPPPQNELSSTLNVDGSIHLEFLGVPGRAYVLQFNASLTNTVWQSLGAQTADVSGLVRFDQSKPGGVKAGFYRAMDQQP